MERTYRTKRLKTVCTNYSAAKKQYGDKMANKIHQRIDEISAAASVEEMIQFRIGRCHPLHGDREGKYAVDLVHPYRLVFTVEKGLVQIAYITEIEDYH